MHRRRWPMRGPLIPPTALLLVLCGSASSQNRLDTVTTVAYTQIPGAAADIGAGDAVDNVWVTGAAPNAQGDRWIYLRNAATNNWTQQPGLAKRVAVDSTSTAWVAASSSVWRWENGNWALKANNVALSDIATAPKSLITLATPKVLAVSSTGSLSYWAGGTNWTALPTTGISGRAVRGAVSPALNTDPEGHFYVLNDAGALYRFENVSWIEIETPAFRASDPFSITGGPGYYINTSQAQGYTKVGLADIAFDSGGILWALMKPDPSSGPNDGVLVKWDGATFLANRVATWKVEPTVKGTALSARGTGDMWLVNSLASIYRVYPAAPTEIPNTLPPFAWPTMTAQPTYSPVPGAVGKALCIDDVLTGKCGNEKADFDGAYTLNMYNCPDGFWDSIYGGTCWKCPPDDGLGGFLRSADAVTGDTACWRVPKETFSRAIYLKSGFSWDCPDGSFWDIRNFGECWKCPDAYPRRTAYAVDQESACVSPLNETKPATLLSFTGCAQPDAVAMKLPGKRLPGKPFLDIGGGWSQNIISGGCYACPITDNDGNFLITDRNINPVTGNEGCSVRMKWQPATYEQPGMAHLPGIKSMIWEKRILDPKQFTSELHLQSAGAGLVPGSTAANTWVKQQWQEVVAKPYASKALRMALYMRLRAAASVAPATRTPTEAALVSAMESYIVSRRTYIAQQGLDMYDAWKAWDTAYRAKLKKPPLLQMFDLGTVPLDFHALTAELGGPTAVGASLLAFSGGMAIAAQQATFSTVSNGAGEVIASGCLNCMYNSLRTGQMLANFAKVTPVTGAFAAAAVVTAAFAVMAQVAIERYIAITTARPKLEQALATARQPVSLQVLLAGANGEDTLAYYWSLAMDVAGETEDAQVIQVATAANAIAAQTAYAK